VADGGLDLGHELMAEAPVPITATLSPAGSWAWSQPAEWNSVPAKLSIPGMSGVRGSLSATTGGWGRSCRSKGATAREPAPTMTTRRWATTHNSPGPWTGY